MIRRNGTSANRFPPPYRSAGILLVLALALLTSPTRAAQSLIAFALDSDDDGRTSRIYVANPDGSGMKPVSPGGGRDRAPAFSPDGKWLVYQSTNNLGLDMIVVQGIDEEKGRPLAIGSNPQWSRDGERILFSRRQLNDYSLFVVRADGSQKDEGLKPMARGQIGRWSPDEKQLAVVAPVILEGRDRWQIQVMPSDSLEARFRVTLPEAFGQVVALDWSPSGDSLLFSATRQGRYDLYVLDLKLDGRAPDPRRVPPGDMVPNPAYGSWSPDGKQILFRSAAETSGGVTTVSRLCLMQADGSQIRTLWEPSNRALRIQSTAWYREPAGAPPPMPKLPAPMPPIPAPAPAPMPPPVPKVLGPPRKVHADKLFSIEKSRSPVSLDLGAPHDADFVITVPVLPSNRWSPRRQGVGITLELEDGGLYRGTVIYSGAPWVTLQGRPKGGKVRLIDGKQFSAAEVGFRKGFKLSVRREGKNMIVSLNDEDVISRPVLTSAIKSISLTLENFDPGAARFNLGGIFYREWVPETAVGATERR